MPNISLLHAGHTHSDGVYWSFGRMNDLSEEQKREIALLYTTPRIVGIYGPLKVFLKTLKDSGYNKLTIKKLSQILQESEESISVEHDRNERFQRRVVLAEGLDTVWFEDLAYFPVSPCCSMLGSTKDGFAVLGTGAKKQPNSRTASHRSAATN